MVKSCSGSLLDGRQASVAAGGQAAITPVATDCQVGTARKQQSPTETVTLVSLLLATVVSTNNLYTNIMNYY